MTRREETAYHEAGHAVVAHLLGIAVTSASIVKDDESAGRIRAPLPEGFQPDEQGEGSIEVLKNHLAVVLAGPAAEGIFADETVAPTGNDMYSFTLLVGSLGGSSDEMSTTADAAWERAEGILRAEWAAVEAMAAALLEREELDGEEVARIIERKGTA